MKFGYIVFNIFFLMLISCADDKNTDENETIKSSEQEVEISAKTIEGFNYKDYVLSSDAEKVVSNWGKYQELAIQINYLKKADLSFFNGEKKLLKDFITEFKAELPDEIRTNPIVSRTVIIETQLLKLHDNLTLSNIDTKAKLQSIREVLVAFANINLQINKKLEFDIYNKIEPE